MRGSSLSEQKASVFSSQVGGLVCTFLSVLFRPPLAPRNQPQPVPSQRLESEFSPGLLRANLGIEPAGAGRAAWWVGPLGGCIPGGGLAGRGEGPPHPALVTEASGSLSSPAFTSTRTHFRTGSPTTRSAVQPLCSPPAPSQRRQACPWCLVRLPSQPPSMAGLLAP